MPIDSGKLLPLPPRGEIETKAVLKKLVTANRHLAELKGVVASIPNAAILINTLALQEAKESSEIENIITTHHDLYRAALFDDLPHDPAAKEVSRYAAALRYGFEKVREGRPITVNLMEKIQELIVLNDAGVRRQRGTVLLNERTQEVVYEPPQEHETVLELLRNLEVFINDDRFYAADPLTKMAIVHYQFEAIHPFYDGNGRVGRILNILYLVAQGLLDLPVLYLSRYIVQRKPVYYDLFGEVHEGRWEPWILFLLEGVEVTSKQTISTVTQMRDLMIEYKRGIRSKLPKIYSQDLLSNMFRHPYTTIDSLMRELGVSRPTATKYLNALVEQGFMTKRKLGRRNYYINEALVRLFTASHTAR